MIPSYLLKKKRKFRKNLKSLQYQNDFESTYVKNSSRNDLYRREKDLSLQRLFHAIGNRGITAHIQSYSSDNEMDDKVTVGYEPEAFQIKGAKLSAQYPASKDMRGMELGDSALLQINRKTQGAQQASTRKVSGEKKGKIKYFLDPSFKKHKLDIKNLTEARNIVSKTDVGHEVLDWILNNGITVDVINCATKEDLDCVSENAGCYKEIGPKEFEAWVQAGQKVGSFQKTKDGVKDWIEQIVNRETQSIADTLFHELLHIWFVTKFPRKGTGHTRKAEYEITPWGKKYREKEYNEKFLNMLKKFDKQVKEKRK